MQLRRSGSKSWLYTLEHELTHALFAVLTLNRVTSLSAQQGSGHLAYEGPGNWLVSLAPYFFPAFCVLPLLALQVAGPAAQPPLLGLLGLTLGLNLSLSLRRGLLRALHLLLRGRLLRSLTLVETATTAATVFTTAIAASTTVLTAAMIGHILAAAILRARHRRQRDRRGRQRQQSRRLEKSCAGHRRSPFARAAKAAPLMTV